ncbi:hypothetical protein NUW54_g7900 [Trametes sanguinea]|uniref:Uncharacterized protein n=1 Tax=Trametes sanguinea TaxID=158606 RepID=A0ACC1PIG9_9APHY|nr:hypothetical protein NUW54_g7900 [Trametes sanguinea]
MQRALTILATGRAGDADLAPATEQPAVSGAQHHILLCSIGPACSASSVAKGFGWPKWGLGIEGVNGLVGEWLLHQLSGEGGEASSEKRNKQWRRRHYHERGAVQDVRIRGWAFMDYYAEPNYAALVPLLVECNYRGRKKGEEGWE